MLTDKAPLIDTDQILQRTQAIRRLRWIEDHTTFFPFSQEDIFSDELTWPGVLTVSGISRGNSKLFLDSVNTTNLTELGESFQKNIAGKTFIDLGCGKPEYAKLPRQLAQIFGSTRYVGVDYALPYEFKRVTDEFPNLGNQPFTSLFMRSTILEFLGRLNPQEQGLAFFISGMQPMNFDGNTGEQYFQTMMDQLQNIMSSGSILIVGFATYDLFPEDHDFSLLASHQSGNNVQGGSIRIYRK